MIFLFTDYGSNDIYTGQVNAVLQLTIVRKPD